MGFKFKILRALNEEKQQKIYAKMHKTAKYPHESVGWASLQRQYLRFEKLTEGVRLDGKSLLDFGCGLGDFCIFLKEKNTNVDFTGIDIMDGFVREASSRCAGSAFFCSSIFDITKKYDYIFSSGTYALCQRELFVRQVEKCFELSNLEYRFNLILNAKSKDFFRISEKELKSILSTFKAKIEYKSGYLESDITVCMQK